jgi:cytoskeletal protein CcmA (bactofilin family)
VTEVGNSTIYTYIHRAHPRPYLVPLAIAWGLLIAAGACAGDRGDSYNTINGSVHVIAGKPAAGVSTINGSIRIDTSAVADSVSTVNGSIDLGARATAKSVTSVNGSITLDEQAQTSEVKSVNGNLTINEGAEVNGALITVNGKIGVRAGHIVGRIRTEEGDISIVGSARVDGGILVEKPSNSGMSFHSSDPTIIIGPGAEVQGELRFDHKVHLFVSDRATVGTVTGATAVTFSGDSPP